MLKFKEKLIKKYNKQKEKFEGVGRKSKEKFLKDFKKLTKKLMFDINKVNLYHNPEIKLFYSMDQLLKLTNYRIISNEKESFQSILSTIFEYLDIDADIILGTINKNNQIIIGFHIIIETNQFDFTGEKVLVCLE